MFSVDLIVNIMLTVEYQHIMWMTLRFTAEEELNAMTL